MGSLLTPDVTLNLVEDSNGLRYLAANTTATYTIGSLAPLLGIAIPASLADLVTLASPAVVYDPVFAGVAGMLHARCRSSLQVLHARCRSSLQPPHISHPTTRIL